MECRHRPTLEMLPLEMLDRTNTFMLMPAEVFQHQIQSLVQVHKQRYLNPGIRYPFILIFGLINEMVMEDPRQSIVGPKNDELR
jgi:hypothetical protein